MSRRLLDLCLLAYPRARRDSDRAYLRDLALDLAEGSLGVARQALSLLLGGLNERIQADRKAWIRRTLVAPCVLAALVLSVNGLAGSVVRSHEVEQFACVGDGGGCTDTRKLVAARERGGWDCKTRRRARQGRHSPSWECTRGSSALG